MLRSKILPCLIYFLIRLWNITSRVTFLNGEIPEKLDAEGKNFIYAFWHGRLMYLIHHHGKQGIAIPASESRDGEILANILSNYGYDVVRGSSGRRGERALLGLVDGLRKGKNAALAVDGPRGPLHEVKIGIAFLAGKLNKPVVPASSGARRYWILEKTWEKLMLPVPFTKGVVIYGEPIYVNGTSGEELEAKRREIEDSLKRLTKEADDYFHK